MKMTFNDVELLSKWLERESEAGFKHSKVTARMQYGIASYTVIY